TEEPKQPTDEKEKANEEPKAPVTFKHMSNLFFAFRPEVMFYEDTVRKTEFLFSHQSISEFAEKADFLFTKTRLPNSHREEQLKMSKFFLSTFGENTATLMDLYEKYSKELLDEKKSKN